jgi:hypothetical protein
LQLGNIAPHVGRQPVRLGLERPRRLQLGLQARLAVSQRLRARRGALAALP